MNRRNSSTSFFSHIRNCINELACFFSFFVGDGYFDRLIILKIIIVSTILRTSREGDKNQEEERYFFYDSNFTTEDSEKKKTCQYHFSVPTGLLPCKDSNPDIQSQNLTYYHYTTGQ